MTFLSFSNKLEQFGLFPLTARDVSILQINVGRKCNLACKHCHLKAGPSRTEIMPREVLESCLTVARDPAITIIDITGGAPEMNPDLEWFISEVATLGKRLIVRSNLVILLDDAYTKFIEIYSRNKVEIVGSLPDLHQERNDRQRGAGVFAHEIRALRLLNEHGYGQSTSGLILDLVHNPVGAFLPGSQKALEHEYKNKLQTDYGIQFNNLYCLTNNPTGRYVDYLKSTDNYEEYMEALVNAFNPCAANEVMCRSTISVGWDGTLYDCDFNQALELSINHGTPNTIVHFNALELCNREIVIADHCYACTAGAGSSCQGALSV